MLVVGFQGWIRSPGLAWLKAGFRHCFVYQQVDGHWVLCDPLARGLLLRAAPCLDAHTLLASLAALGISVVAVDRSPQTEPMAWLRPFTCVELCKRLTGDRRLWPVTPYQLFRHVIKPRNGA